MVFALTATRLAQSFFSSWQYWVLICPRHDVFVGKKLVERSDRCSGTLRDIAHRCRLKSHLGEDRGGRFQQPRHPFFSPLLYRNASGRKFGL